MSEAYCCDRCGETREGSPFASVIIGEGRERNRQSITGDPEYEAGPPRRVGKAEFDYCRSCINDFRNLHAAAEGDPSDVERAVERGADE